MSNHKKPVDENNGIHIEEIMGSVPCARHGADINDACWNLGTNLGIMRAICDKRARSAGANGDVTPHTTYKKKESSR